MGLHLIGGSSSHLVSPLVGVAIAGLIGWRGAFVAISLPVFVFGVALFWILTRDAVRARTGPGGAAVRSDEAAAEVPTRPSVIAFIPLFLVDVFGASEHAAAIFLSAFFVTGLWASPLGGSISDRFGPLTVFVNLALAIGPLIMLLGVAPHWIVVALVMLGIGVTLFVRMPVSEAYLVTAVRKKSQSTLLGIYFFAGMEGSGILTPILGHTIDLYGFRTGFAGVGAVLTVIVAAGCIALFVLKRTRHAESILA